MSTTYSRLIVILPRAPNHMVGAVSPTAMSRTGLTCNPFRISIFRAAQTFKQRPASLEPLTARGGFPPGLAMACSLRDSLQGSRGVKSTSPDPTNQLPTSHSGQAQRPPGGSTAHLQLFKSSTSHPWVQPAAGLAFTASLQLFENSNRPVLTQAQHLWETEAFCGTHFAPYRVHC